MKKIYLKNVRELTDVQSNYKYVIQKGDYTLGLEDTKEEFLYLSNNDGGVKNIAFLLDGLKNVVLDFSGSTITFQGRIAPFIVRKRHA